MGKILKYCAKCEEGFAAKFGFCPNCGETLEAFEMNPVMDSIQPEAKVEDVKTESFSSEALPPIRETVAAETVEFSEPEVIELESADVVEKKTYEVEPATTTASPVYFSDDEPAEDNHDRSIFGFGSKGFDFSNVKNTQEIDESYNPTVMVDKDTQLRNSLLVSLACIVVSATMIAWVVSLFVHALPVSALENEELFAYVGAIDEKPPEMEKEKKDDDKEGGGGGGGGKERDRDANQGQYPNQSRNPNNYITPMEQRDFELKQYNVTEGPPITRPMIMPTGIPNSLMTDLGSGRGRGNGIGNGDGNGVGNGIGTGNGNGIGSGEGNGVGNGRGDGRGDGTGDPNEPQLVKGVSSPVKILFKQQAKYTDAARQNNVQGSVTLRVTFTAAGTIGAISPVNGLPYGLTEQAIAAARTIRFEPAKRNGVPYTTSKTIVFSFTIY